VLAMLGKQSGLDGGSHAYLDHVGRDSFYGFSSLCTAKSCSLTRTSPTFIVRAMGVRAYPRAFDGHKAQVAVDPESQLITAVDVLAGNAPDHERALELVEQAQANASVMVQ
jgi:hypothetical protein